MMTVSFTVSDELYAAFQQKFPVESQAAEALKGALIGLVQDDPYSPAAYAEDERRYQDAVQNNSFVAHEDVMAKLDQQLVEARARQGAQV